MILDADGVDWSQERLVVHVTDVALGDGGKSQQTAVGSRTAQ